MGDCIALENGSLWGGASWFVCSVLKDVAVAMRDVNMDPAFSRWLLDCSRRPNGLAGFDMRGLNSEQRAKFFKAAAIALETRKEKGPQGWKEPENFESYIDKFALLVRKQGAPNYRGTIKWDGRKIDICEIWFSEST